MKYLMLPIAVVCAWVAKMAVTLAVLVGCLLWPLNLQSQPQSLQPAENVQLVGSLEQAQPTSLQVGINPQQ